MKTYLDCIPCFVRQALDASRFATDDERVHEEVLRRVIQDVQSWDMQSPPPVMGQQIHRSIRELCGGRDPYAGVKKKFNDVALTLYDELKHRVAAASDPLEIAIRLAIAGNIIDFGAGSGLEEEHVATAMEEAFHAPVFGDLCEVKRRLDTAEKIFYIAANAGELVFDRLLIEVLPLDRVTLAVRGAPVINDATLEDARACGLMDLVTVIDNASDAPGTILDECSRDFRRAFDEADLVVSKGQGNYETLSRAEKPILFLLKAKCPVIARDVGCVLGRLVAFVSEPNVSTEEP